MDENAKKDRACTDKNFHGASGQPHPSDIEQHRLGDCYFVSSFTRRFTAICAFALCSVSSACGAADATTGSKAHTQFIAGSLCAKEDKIVFSCPLAKSKKIVSICAAGDAMPHRFYYAFGRPNAPELIYPQKSESETNKIDISRLNFAGATAGIAYSFVNNGYKYIAYDISGTGFENGGVLVQEVGQLRASANMKCQKEKLYSTDDSKIFDETKNWKHDSEIEQHGLPHTPSP
jgi:hypothetical protein